MIDIKFNLTGGGDAFEKAMLKEVKKSISKAVGGARCAEHGSQPKLICKGRTIDNMDIRVEACCEEFAQVVERRLK